MANEQKLMDFNSITLKLSSPEEILSWSFGEVTKPETINYRTQRSERDGLFDERIFGPEKDYECYCGKYRRVRYKGLVCEKCGVEVTRSSVRRERMGHIVLAVPTAHIWFVRGTPSRLGLLLDMSIVDLEKVIYFAGYIIIKVNEDNKNEIFSALEKEYKTKIRKLESKKEKTDLKEVYRVAKKEVNDITAHRVLDEHEFRHLSLKYGECFEALSGAEALFNICKELDLRKLSDKFTKKYEDANPQARKKLLKQISLVNSLIKSKNRPEWMFLTVLPVIPPALRPMVQLDGGRHATSDVNDLYRRVLNRNNRLKRLLELNAPDVIVKNEKRMLQEAIDSLIDNSIRRTQGVAAVSQSQKRPLRSLADMLRGKHGRFRQNLLGKRVDYSGRSVIVVGPELKMHQCGLPKLMALELFRPFIISKIIQRELAHNVRGANRLIDEKTDDVWEILENVITDKYVLLNRAPTLHRLGVQAFLPVLIDGNAIQLHPLVCSAFNADFDGDQMAVHIPLGEEAQKEAAELMASNKNLLIPRTGRPVVNPSQDIVLGCFFMTRAKPGSFGEGRYFSSPNDAINAYDFNIVELQALIKVKIKKNNKKYNSFNGDILETTVGRLLFNSVLPDDFAFINDELTKKKLANLVEQLIRCYGVDATPPILDKIKDFGFEYASRSGISWGMEDLRVPDEKGRILREAEKKEAEIYEYFNNGFLSEEERYYKIIEIWQEAKNKIDEKVPQSLDIFGPVFSMVSSAARASWGQVNQMAGMKGLVMNPAGKIIDFPIKSSYKEGLSILEYFISTHGARKGTADTALKTAKAGYLTRRLVDVAQDVIISEEDCKDKNGFLIKRSEEAELGISFFDNIMGRVLAKNLKVGRKTLKAGHFLTFEDAGIVNGASVEEVYVRSPLSCNTSWGICKKCYGQDLGRGELIKLGEAVGIVAAQAIGEPGTQLTLRTFHTGGVAADSGDITLGLPRIDELFEMRTPANPAVISEIDGTVLRIKELTSADVHQNQERAVTVEKDKKSKEYPIPFGKRVIVKVGQEIKAGQPLSDGPIDVKALFKIAGQEAAQRYIIREVGWVYDNQGVSINNKHLEVVVRQMFSRFRVKDSGDTNLNRGKIVERAVFLKENKRVKEKGGREATVIETPMGISKVSLSAAGFLSAASFQDTARVLIGAATEGVRDVLRGLKENVIIGHLIPAGTGFRKDLKSLHRFKEDESEDVSEE